jgi:uroporphyrinogen-III synthase
VVECCRCWKSPLPDQSALLAALARLHQYALVAFVSPNAIDAAFAHIRHWPAGVTAAVVGEGSRAALAAHGVPTSSARRRRPSDPNTCCKRWTCRAATASPC